MEGLSLLELHRALIEQLRQRQLLTNSDVAMAFNAIPRHLFLPQFDPREVYQDRALPLKTDSSGATLSSASQPTMIAVMLQQLDLKAGMNIMEVGTASGYNAALIGHIVGDRGQVTTLEIDRDLAEQAREKLHAAGYGDVLVVNQDAVSGFEARAEYDRIIATAGLWDVPESWFKQLHKDGKLITPIWLDGVQVSASFALQADGSWLSSDNRPCAFVYLQGLAAAPRLSAKVGSSSLEVLADDLDKIDTAGLHLLLSQDREIHRLAAKLRPEDFWFGFQLYLMLNEPRRYVFAVYAIPAGMQAYGVDDSGILLFTPGSAAFTPYEGEGVVYTFGGAAAFMKMQSLFDEWQGIRGSILDRLRLRLMPKSLGKPHSESGKLYLRKDHNLQVWLA
jgi:protein-L-isoaspartate(D-aspartate) O-methyltransferase